ncbi:MAG: S-layer homology domain-containing protein [Bacillota bacterium]|jgi:hypothetical protein
MNSSRKIISFILIFTVFFSVFCTSAFGAYNTVPSKMYPKLLSAELISGTSENVQIELGFSNNVAAISETQDGRYDMIGINEKNEEQFSMTDSGGNDVQITISRHDGAAMHTDESKLFYVNADGLDVNETYTITVTDELYANMGNSLACPYEVTFCIASGEIDFKPLGKLPEIDISEPLTFNKCNVSTNAKDVPVDTVFTMFFSHNVSGVDVLEFNSQYVKLYEGENEVSITLLPGEKNEVKEMIIKPDEKLKYNTEYKIYCTTNMMARNGNYLSSPVAIYFTTEKDPNGGGSEGGGSEGGGSEGGGSEGGGSEGGGSEGGGSEGGGSEDGGSDEDLANKVYFSDVKGTWAAADINYLAEQKIVNGNPDGTFAPNAGISRAEAIAMLVRGFNITSDITENPFVDIDGHWGKSFIIAAYNAGIVKGSDASHFNPDAKITREEFAAMVVRIGKLTLGDKPVIEFTDKDKISEWAKENVDIASANGIIGGYPDGTFAPKNNVTRAEACHMIVNLLNVSASS